MAAPISKAVYELVARAIGRERTSGGTWRWLGKVGNPDWDTADTAKLACESSGLHLDHVARIGVALAGLQAIISQEEDWDAECDDDCSEELWKQGYSEAIGEAASKARATLALLDIEPVRRPRRA